MRESKQYKTVAITYADDKPLEFVLLVTDISYHDSYIKVEYRETLMHLAEQTAGTDWNERY